MTQRDQRPRFCDCLAMMRDRDPQVQEDGFHWLLPQASDFIDDLLEAFDAEKDQGLRCWLLELIGNAKSEQAIDVLTASLDVPNLRHQAIAGLRALDTKASRTALYNAGVTQVSTRRHST